MNIQAFFKVTYGLYILSSRNKQGKLNGHVNNTLLQVTAEPARFIVASNKKNLTTEYIQESGVFAASVLQQNVDLKFMGPWGFQSGHDIEKFTEGVQYRIGQTGAPIVLDKAIAFIECRVINTIDVGTHIVFVGEVTDAGLLGDTQTPLTYSYYRDVIKGVSPENAPTYIDKSKLGQTAVDDQPTHQKYQCVICGYIYDPTEGDPDSGIAPGTAFEDIPDNWQCPICGVSKRDFKPIEV